MPRVKKKKDVKTRGPLTAAGLISFYEELDEGVKLSPTAVIIFATVFSLAVIILSKIFPA